MPILLFTVFCAAGVVLLFWQLKASDRTTADRLHASLAEEAGAPAAEARS